MIALCTAMMRLEPAPAVLPAPAQAVSASSDRHRRWTFFLRCLLLSFLAFSASSAQAQTFRFNLRAEPDVIPANGISTSTILVQVQNTANSGIGAAPLVRFLTTRGTIERQARLTGGVARVLLRSTTTPGTAVVTAFIGGSSEQVAVEFSGDKVGGVRYLEVVGPYVAYGSERGVITGAGRCVLEYGDTHIESDVRLDVDLYSERIWAQGNSGNVLIRHGRGENAHELRGDRLYYDLRRRRGVMRRSDTTLGAARQEFMDSDFKPLPAGFLAEPGEADKSATTNKENTAKENTNKENAAKAAESVTPPASITPSTEPPPAAPAPTAPAPLPDAGAATQAGGATQQEIDLTLPDASSGGAMSVLENVPYSPNAPEQERAALSLQAPDVPALSLTGNDDGASGESRTAALLPEPGTASEGTAPGKAGAPGETEEKSPAPVPEYQPLPANNATGPIRLVEPLPPRVENTVGYWIAAKRMRVFPQDKIQFQQAKVFFNGRKLFSMPLYVVPVNGAPNPISDIVSLNTSAGLSLNVPYYYMASPRGTGSISLIHTPGGGFAAGNPGFSIALAQQYWMSKNSYGQVAIDQIGHGGWNANWQHSLQFSPTLTSNFYLDMPEHKNIFFRNSIYKDFQSVQLGFEGLYSRPDGGLDDAQAQFFARLRPRSIGRSGWVYYVAGSIVARRRYIDYRSSGSGGGIGLPGRGGRPGDPRIYPLLGQTLNATLQAPTYRIWKGASVQGSMFATAFNYSNDRRGVAPGVNLGLTQKLGRVASFQLDYSYDKGGGSLYGDNFSHYLSGTFLLNLGEKISASAYLTKSLADNATYGFAGLDYFFARKWRAGLIADYSRFSGTDPFLNFGWSIGRMIGQRELSLNWDRARGNVYFEFGNLLY
ncbi:MAG TPA: Ig-like domain-containing protein [Abditibacteriaceae bacterium]|nr:Ig-like domain-containing protein [Abditibacteriaceae bacterium]